MASPVGIQMKDAISPINLAALLLVAGEHRHEEPAVPFHLYIRDTAAAWLLEEPRADESWVQFAAALC